MDYREELAKGVTVTVLIYILYLVVIALLLQFLWNTLISKVINIRPISYYESLAVIILVLLIRELF